MFPSVPGPWKQGILALSLALAGAPGAAQEAPGRGAVEPVPIGINLRPITAYDRAWVFSDAMKMTSEWRYDDDRESTRVREVGGKGHPKPTVVPLDANGWPMPQPGRSVSCNFFVSMRGLMPVGEYVVTWRGTGNVELVGHVGIVTQEPNRLVARIDGVNGGQPGLRLSNVSRTDPIRDIRVWLPGLEDSCHAFHPVFLDRLRPFSVLRFYPWMRVYSSTGRWSKRNTPVNARQGGPEGVALEYMVDLCNELGADPWFCIPHVADDEYVRNFATLVRESLHRDAKVYVEFSNETWNTDFLAGKWAREQAQLRGISAMKVVAERSAQVFDIWHEVFGNRKDRIVRVAGVQLHNIGIANTLCRALEGKFDAMAVGAYFGARADRDPVDSKSSAADLMDVALANLESTVLPRIADHRALAETVSRDLGRPIALLTYEAGQSIVARSPGGGLDLEATLECQEMPQMFDGYRMLIEGAAENGVELFVAYDFAGPRSGADTFSVLEHIQEPLSQAVKYRALIQGWESRRQ